MNRWMMSYKNYLETDCRFHPQTIAKHLSDLNQIFSQFQIASVHQINENKVLQAWRYHRWEITKDGIQFAESKPKDGIWAFKNFLKYLENSECLFPKGLSDIIKLSQPPQQKLVKLKGLTFIEQAKLREYLLFNINDDLQRRNTALIFMILKTDCSVKEALTLNIHQNCFIYPDKNSGDFHAKENQLLVDVRKENVVQKRICVSKETITFLNFYLENRKHKNHILFTKDSGKQPASRLTLALVKKAIKGIFEEAGILIPSKQIFEVLRETYLNNYSTFDESLHTKDYGVAYSKKHKLMN